MKMCVLLGKILPIAEQGVQNGGVYSVVRHTFDIGWRRALELPR